jgi:hypothetical protein
MLAQGSGHIWVQYVSMAMSVTSMWAQSWKRYFTRLNRFPHFSL